MPGNLYNSAAVSCASHGLERSGGLPAYVYGGLVAHVDVQLCSFDRNSGHGVFVSGGAETRLADCKCFNNRKHGFAAADALLKLLKCEYTASLRTRL